MERPPGSDREALGQKRQWELNRANFDGHWQGPTRWYLRQPSGFDFQRPSLDIPQSTYAIAFSDADHGTWHGTGLRFAPGNERILPLSRNTYNSSGSCWQFPGAGGQSSLTMTGDVARCGHEINLFSGRSRSMLIALFEPMSDGSVQLESVGATAFRCQRGSIDPPRGPLASADELLERVCGWPGERHVLEPGVWPEEPSAAAPITGFEPAAFALHCHTAAFDDNLVCSLPDRLPAGPFQLQFGCLLRADHFAQVCLSFDAAHHLSRWELSRHQPPRAP
ncbi:hypothetical protein KBY86_03620 [Synechococcus sp. Lug-A]|uniref:hypothetical protein n=1 Tax=Synechococcus sp. Lug-A TaxID=2823740 RepID=UPI0020CF5A8C|nr:hypothetical protein [Synechococcus sp. Lug-A]MCP9845985.1 hypothetical protein [Synechococcus sp. Lug-A]